MRARGAHRLYSNEIYSSSGHDESVYTQKGEKDSMETAGFGMISVSKSHQGSDHALRGAMAEI